MLIGLFFGPAIGYVFYYFFSLPDSFLFNYPVTLIVLFFLPMYAVSYIIVKKEIQKYDKSQILIKICFFFYTNIKIIALLLTISLLIFFFLKDYEAFLVRYEPLHKFLVCVAYILYTSAFIIIISTVVLFLVIKKKKIDLFSIGNTNTTHTEANTIGTAGQSQIISSEIYLLALLIFNVSIVGLVYKEQKEIYSILTTVGFLIYFYWVHNKETTKSIHIIKNSVYSSLLLISTVFIMVYSSTIAMQMFRFVYDVSKTTQFYEDLQDHRFKVEESLLFIEKNALDIRISSNELQEEIKALEDDIGKINSDCNMIKYHINEMKKLAIDIIESEEISYSKMEKFEKNYQDLSYRLERLKKNINVVLFQTKTTYKKGKVITERINTDIEKIEESLKTIQNVIRIK